MERCPACRGRLGEVPVCARCGCDYTLAIHAETQARILSCRAIQAWRDGDRDLAAVHIGESLALKHSRLAEAVAAMLRASAKSEMANAPVALTAPGSADAAPLTGEEGRNLSASEFYLAMF